MNELSSPRRQGGATVGLLLCTVGFMPIQALFVSSPSLGYLIAALIFSVCGLFSMWWCFSGVKERYIEIVPDHHKPSILKSFCAIFRNPPLLVLCVANLCTLAAFNIKLAIGVLHPVRTQRYSSAVVDGFLQHGMHSGWGTAGSHSCKTLR